MIQDYINSLIDDFFQAREDQPASLGSWKNLMKWEMDFRFFCKDTFRQWLASRSNATINHLLDLGFSASDEQQIVKALENDLESFFRSSWEGYEKQIVLPLKIIPIGALLWAFSFVFLAIKCSSSIWKISCLCYLIGGMSICGAGILFCLNRKNLLRRSKRFISQFFVVANAKWEQLQNQKLKINKEQ